MRSRSVFHRLLMKLKECTAALTNQTARSGRTLLSGFILLLKGIFALELEKRYNSTLDNVRAWDEETYLKNKRKY